ncbi:MAG TPA: hypothetical protein VNZ45_10300 [Bacteroidia bacterium]|jgi:hypothetical protein|nr:hypothetical protein [Bacteroidia bacterium]
MNIRNLILSSALVLTFGFSKAQTNASWKPLWLSTTNMFKGVEGFYQFSACNGADVLLVKLVNHNNYSVKSNWKALVITQDGQQHSGKNAQDSLVLAPNSELAGDCAGSKAQLSIKLSDFGTNEGNFKAFIASGFDFVIIH